MSEENDLFTTLNDESEKEIKESNRKKHNALLGDQIRRAFWPALLATGGMALLGYATFGAAPGAIAIMAAFGLLAIGLTVLVSIAAKKTSFGDYTLGFYSWPQSQRGRFTLGLLAIAAVVFILTLAIASQFLGPLALLAPTAFALLAPNPLILASIIGSMATALIMLPPLCIRGFELFDEKRRQTKKPQDEVVYEEKEKENPANTDAISTKSTLFNSDSEENDDGKNNPPPPSSSRRSSLSLKGSS